MFQHMITDDYIEKRVSLDEETANLVRYQHAYDAAAKVLKTADENFRTLISMFGR